MRLPASTDKEVMLREINEAEAALAEASMVLGCKHIIDPTDTLGDRVRHLAMLAILTTAALGQLKQKLNAQLVDRNLDSMSPSDLLGEFGEEN